MNTKPTPPAILSLADSLRLEAAELKLSLEQLAMNHGQLEARNLETGGLVMVVTSKPRRWPPLDIAGQRLQSKVRKQYRQFHSLLLTVLKDESSEIAENSIHQTHSPIVNLIERRDTSKESNRDAADRAIAALDRQLVILAGIHSEHEDLIVVPDTNALYWNPALEEWKAPGGVLFSIALTPLVVEELDRHKAERGNKSRREKAKRLIRQIGEYRRRGRLVDGVPLVNGVSRIFAVPTSAQPREFFDWLTGVTVDDYFFASALAVMRLNSRAPTVILTRDVNLQTKIEFARLSFWTPDVVTKKAAGDA